MQHEERQHNGFIKAWEDRWIDDTCGVPGYSSRSFPALQSRAAGCFGLCPAAESRPETDCRGWQSSPWRLRCAHRSVDPRLAPPGSKTHTAAPVKLKRVSSCTKQAYKVNALSTIFSYFSPIGQFPTREATANHQLFPPNRLTTDTTDTFTVRAMWVQPPRSTSLETFLPSLLQSVPQSHWLQTKPHYAAALATVSD